MGDEKPLPDLSREEYLALSDQKAQDWRWISGVNPTMFGAAGALLAAGISQHQGIVVGLAPLPLFLSELEAGAVHDSGEVLLQYVSPRWDPWDRIVRPTLRTFGPRVVAKRSGMSLSAAKEQLARGDPGPTEEMNSC